MDASLQIIRITLCVLIVVSSPLILSIIKKYLDKLKDDKLRSMVKTFVEAAEQTLKDKDPTGEKRKQYVINSLKSLDIDYNDYVDALIEQAVLLLWDLDDTDSASLLSMENTLATLEADTSM